MYLILSRNSVIVFLCSLKVLICGDGAIGKTCLVDTLCEKDSINWDAPEYNPTMSDNLERVWTDADHRDWNISLWDTAGQEALCNLRKPAYPGTQVLLIGFDMTKGVSLENIQTWLEEVYEVEPNVGCIIVVGTKCDFFEELEAGGVGSDGRPLKTMEEMQAIAVEIGAHGFVCTSAKNGYGLLDHACEGPAVDADPDTMSGNAQYLNCKILEFGLMLMNGDAIPVLRGGPVAPQPKPVQSGEVQAPAAAPAEAGQAGGAPMSQWV